MAGRACRGGAPRGYGLPHGLGEPRHVDITGGYAYVVVPATFDYNRLGKPVNQTGASFTVALRKVDGNWRLTAWAWTKGKTTT